MPLQQNEKIVIGSAAALTILITVILVVNKKKTAAADNTTGGKTNKNTSSAPGTNKSQGDNTQSSGSASSNSGQSGGGQSSGTPAGGLFGNFGSSIGFSNTVNVPSIDLSGTWQSQKNSSYKPLCDSFNMSFDGNDTLNVPYETTASGTITYINNSSIVAAQPPGAVIGTVTGIKDDGSTDVGSTIVWNDVNGDTWTKVSN